MNGLRKHIQLANELECMIKKSGISGERFVSARMLARKEEISLVTAQNVLTELKHRGVISVFNNAYYVTCGRVLKGTPLYALLESERKAPVIGIHLPEINNPFFSSLSERLIDSVRRRGYIPIVMCSNNNADEEKRILKEFVLLGAEGVITGHGRVEDMQDMYKDYILPTVFFANGLTDVHLVDNRGAASQVADHLIKMGYRQFMFIGLFENSDRQLGFANRLKDKGYDLPDENIINLVDKKEFKIPGSVRQKILRSEKPLGIFCYHDLIATQLLLSCKNMNIPDEVGIVGFDDLSIASQIKPTLTTISYRYDKMAESLAERLIRCIDNDEYTVKSEYINHVLNARQSTKRV